MGTFRTARLARGAAGAVLAACAALPAASAAAVQEPGPGGAVRVVPPTARPGTEVELRAPSCRGTTGTARSAAFVTDAVLAPFGGQRGLFGEAAVRSDAEPRTYRVAVECAGASPGGGRVAVLAASDPASPSTAPTAESTSSPPPSSASPSSSPPSSAPTAGGIGSPAPSAAPTDSPSPVAPVPAGGGGTADNGPGTAQTILGFGLAGGAALIVAGRAVLLHRRNRGSTGG